MKVLPRNIITVMHREEEKTAIAAGAVRFSADQYRGMKRVEDITIGKNECHNLGLALSVQLKVEF